LKRDLRDNLSPFLFFSIVGNEMATAPLKNAELRTIPLREANLTELEALFDEQCDEWLEDLRWDYQGPSRMIREVARQRELSGFAAVSGNCVAGFAYYVIEAGRCSIGDIYVSKDWRGAGADRQMLAAMLDEIERQPHVRRIESQCIGMGNDGASALFASRNFQRFDRYYMIADLSRSDSSKPSVERGGSASNPSSTVRIRAWEEDDFALATRVIHRSYRGGPDSLINSQYKTEDGCAELLTILTDHIWCGDFLPYISRVAVRRSTQNMVGALIASRLAVRAGHIGQISVHPAYQGQGVGRRLLESAMEEFDCCGFNSVSLAVTAANEPALHLYESCGFRKAHAFPVFCWEK
jgi:ribosomal protein S18 acetylase RimI-like enzyme